MDVSGLPVWLLLLLVVVVAISIAVAAISLTNRVMPEVGKEHNGTMSPFITVVGLVYGALLGFTVVVAWQQFYAAHAVVANEAATLTTMYRQTVAMPEPEQTQLRQLLRQYATAVAGPEWESQSRGATSDSARAEITGMYSVIGGQPSGVESGPINQTFLNQLSVLATDRATRIIDAKPRIPPLLWTVLIFGGMVLVTLTAFLRMGSTLGHMVVSGTIAVLLGQLLCIVFLLDHPFGTHRGITPESFQQSLQVFDSVDRGT
ncbi:DUF4239 domain-containing protein [Mycobacterium attenuatum]|uniref:bestrophin-like domain n=1 Tax=Mycobacterium attenuatum TaxID=2341086 RepID=UPI000F0439C4|nr:DUF4239 domain-containing protein [Mycobacterium attenuatum]VBA57343.1 hypothetical protein LAUMK41_02399 [Mycobacterium attenuatum]